MRCHLFPDTCHSSPCLCVSVSLCWKLLRNYFTPSHALGYRSPVKGLRNRIMAMGNLLISQCLLAGLSRRTCEGLLNLKDLLTGTASSGSETLSRFAGQRDVV